MRIIIVTGLAGAGKSTALRALEDLGYTCVDNLPLPLFARYIDVVSEIGVERVALSVDGRQHEFLARFSEEIKALRAGEHQVEVLFLEADDATLVRRFSETRRRHPLAGDHLEDGIARDREVLAQLRENASVLSTADLNVHELKAQVDERYGREAGDLAITIQSFGFKHGLPADSDLVFDVRFLPNPHFVPELRPKDGRDEPVSTYVLSSEEGSLSVQQITEFLEFTLPRYAREGKSYLTVSVGCTGGRHRSVAISEELRSRLGNDWNVIVRHRDLNRGR